MDLFSFGRQIFVEVTLESKQRLGEVLSTTMREIREKYPKDDAEIIQVIKETKQKYTFIYK
jgi:hypothetical protein